MKTTNYEISKKLAKIGFSANSHYRQNISDEDDNILEEYDSYDLETILEALPNFIKERPLVLDVAFGEIHYEGDSDNETLFITTTKENESLSDIAAKLLIKLHEQGLVKFGGEDENL